jgi:hypothetical protein
VAQDKSREAPGCSLGKLDAQAEGAEIGVLLGTFAPSSALRSRGAEAGGVGAGAEVEARETDGHDLLGDVSGNPIGVFYDAVDDAGLALGDPREANDVEARAAADSLGVTWRTVLVEHFGWEPVEVASEPRGPDDRSDTGVPRVEFARRVNAQAWLWCLDWSSSAGGASMCSRRM